ncbi:hypothetical protein EX895_006086 [Sporisorium graminicola]|uniref:SPT2 chromatin protein n=1 Tax=Sporisorium graminicola TaxID=280036 RepID=A0A4U7KMC1_9BASI|nr:hypothetical protein EX895_006086 [Sporisorium graminicola]TKY85006.1 hypothetical protein EX895_006086 [Sporisorium graminicola]
MSSYAKLKEMALKKAEEEQAALNKERERKEREAAVKLAAREAQEREQKERERRILVQRMTRQKEEEARERVRKEHAVKLQQNKVASDDGAARSTSASSSKQSLSGLTRPKNIKAPGSTHKVDLSDRLKANSSNGSAARRKRKADQDDFVGNRLEKISASKTDRKASSASASAPKKKAVPMTREEKQAIKRAREFGSIPRLPPIGRLSASSDSSRSSPNLGVGDDSAGRLWARSHLAKDNGLVALGTKKRDQRSIDEIERDLRRLKDSKAKGKSDGPSQAELEREAALLRRQKAMEEKRRSDLEARERAALIKETDSADDSKDDLFGSEDDDGVKVVKRTKAAPSKTINKSTSHVPAINTPTNGSSGAAQPKEPRSIVGRAPGGINPADFLPGAPLRPEAMARLSQKARTASNSASNRKSPDPDSVSKSKRPSFDSKAASPSAAAAISPAAPPKRETARDRFIREQEEQKKMAAGLANGHERRGGRLRSQSPDEYDSEEGDYDDEYDSEGIDDDEEDGSGGRGGSQSYRDEIWKIFGKDRKKYASRIVDSDDDMEADAASVLQEELRSSKQAREEDLREEQLEKQREREKLLRKQGSKRG